MLSGDSMRDAKEDCQEICGKMGFDGSPRIAFHTKVHKGRLLTLFPLPVPPFTTSTSS